RKPRSGRPEYPAIAAPVLSRSSALRFLFRAVSPHSRRHPHRRTRSAGIMYPHDRRAGRHRKRVGRRGSELDLARRITGDPPDEGLARGPYQYGIAERTEGGQGIEQRQIVPGGLGEPDSRVDYDPRLGNSGPNRMLHPGSKVASYGDDDVAIACEAHVIFG